MERPSLQEKGNCNTTRAYSYDSSNPPTKRPMSIHLNKKYTREMGIHGYFRNCWETETRLTLITCGLSVTMALLLEWMHIRTDDKLNLSTYISTESMNPFDGYFSSMYNWNGYSQLLPELPHVFLSLWVIAIIQERSSRNIWICPAKRVNKIFQKTSSEGKN